MPREAAEQSAGDVAAVNNAMESLGHDMQQRLSISSTSSLYNGIYYSVFLPNHASVSCWICELLNVTDAVEHLSFDVYCEDAF